MPAARTCSQPRDAQQTAMTTIGDPELAPTSVTDAIGSKVTARGRTARMRRERECEAMGGECFDF